MLWCTELVVNPRKHQVAVEEMALHTNRWPSYPKLTLLLILLVVVIMLRSSVASSPLPLMLMLKTILVVDDDGDRGKLEQKPDTEEGRGAMNSKCPTPHLHNLLSNHCSCHMRYT